jgi:hypothetical protein
MKIEELKVIWDLAKSIAKAGLLLWVFETTAFLVIDGWHLKATNPIEIMLDDCVKQMLSVASFLAGYVGVSMLIKLNKYK